MEQRCTTLGLYVGDINLYNYVSAHTHRVISPSCQTQQTSCHLPSSADYKRSEDGITVAEPETTGLVSAHMFFSIKHIPLQNRKQKLYLSIAVSEKRHMSHGLHWQIASSVEVNMSGIWFNQTFKWVMFWLPQASQTDCIFHNIRCHSSLLDVNVEAACMYATGICKTTTGVREADGEGSLSICSQCK